MRNRLTSGLISRLAVAAAMLASVPSMVGAWDEDRVASQIQPYMGAWAGMYMVERQDLKDLIPGTPDDFFSSVRPAAGVSLGVAYSRLHVGINGGYQLIDGDYGPTNSSSTLANGEKITWLARSYYYRYQVIPLDISIDAAMLPNESPINFLIGASVGIGLVGIQLPIMTTARWIDTAHTSYTTHSNEWNYNNFLMATGYVGARINLARRLNLEGQLGYRVLKADEVQLGKGAQLVKTYETTRVDSSAKISSGTTTSIPISLSSAYVRADIRWTFSSQSQRDEDRASQRSLEMTQRLAMLPRARLVD